MANYFTLCGYRELKKQDVRAGSNYLIFLTDTIRKINIHTLLLELTPTLPQYSVIVEDSYEDFQTVEIHANLFPNTLDYSETPIAIWDANKLELLDTSHKKILDVCSRAEQSFIDCTTCVRMREESGIIDTTDCILHTLIPQKTNFSFNPKHYENRKIAGFDWVNPKWSAPTYQREFSAYYRPLEEHDFSEVAERKEELQQQATLAAQTRARGILRKETMCSKCSVRSGCEESRTQDEFNICYDYYPDTIEKDILKATTTKLTIPQVSYILWFSGLVPFRINNRKQWLTLNMTAEGELVPILRSVRTPYYRSYREKEVLTWEETSEIIDKIKKESRYQSGYSLTDVPQIPEDKLALLFEACAISVSPTRRSPWHNTEYNTAYISYGPRDAVIMHFSWPNVRQGRWELPWTLDLTNMENIYKYYRRFNYAQPIPVELK